MKSMVIYFVWSLLHSFSHTENAVLSYSPALKTIILKLLTNILFLCKVFCTTAWNKEQLQRGLCWSILLLHTGTRSFSCRPSWRQYSEETPCLQIWFMLENYPTPWNCCHITVAQAADIFSSFSYWVFPLFFFLSKPLSFCERNCHSCIKWFLVRQCFSTHRMLASEAPIQIQFWIHLLTEQPGTW